MTHEQHVIFGTGPVGCWIARSLQAMNLPTRAINRTGYRPALMPADVEIVAANAANQAEAIAAAQGATVIYQALNPPYHRWQQEFPALQAAALAAAKSTGARYVSIDNLYMYDSAQPITETSPIAPLSQKGKLRAHMAEAVMAAHSWGEIQATVLRSSDYYGPGVTGSALGDMVFGNLVEGKKAQVGGSATMPHSFAYIEDVGRAAAVLGTRPEALGQIWIAPHAPAVTQADMVKTTCQILGVEPQLTVISPLMMRLAGLFIPEARASVEMMYEFTQPFEVRSHAIGEAFSLQPTSIQTGLERTVNWYREQLKGKPDN
ncbi:NAD-dependent epimerase/dehydratase family protein [Nodosilinea nodulosa]|uniref:NAD-dependent epimerase/dehydratase family protein n=1 Tax=Nodosilinea nodulosa TaxID=416001 RepID=UPI0002D305AF|nr:NAD-dependent epimerase/dehydratase family protein [Nodosilinea nodulosa]